MTVTHIFPSRNILLLRPLLLVLTTFLCIEARSQEPDITDWEIDYEERYENLHDFNLDDPVFLPADTTEGFSIFSLDDGGTLDPNRDWWHLLKRGKLDMKDTTVVYPRFLRFCVDVYNWADHAFNSYDTTYVSGTGKRWKARILNDDWVDSYALNLDKKLSMRMLSDIYCNLGAYLQYMAVSIGYTIDVSNIMGNKKANHKKMEFGFNCARFNVDAYYSENTGGTYLRTFGKYKDGHLFKSRFHGLTLYKFGVDAYYFLNNRRYSQGAAYNFSKIQRKSAGSFIAGFSYSNLNASLDFSTLDPKLEPFLTIAPNKYRFHYNNYCLLLGYGFNWVITPKLLFNITAMPTIGIANCYEDSVEGSGNLLSLNIKGKGSLTYNLGNVFFCCIAKIDGNWYRSDRQSFFSSIENFSANVGIRF